MRGPPKRKGGLLAGAAPNAKTTARSSRCTPAASKPHDGRVSGQFGSRWRFCRRTGDGDERRS
jgi:hypothetical protein